MFDPIYRIFISATYLDLQKERTEIMNSIIEYGHIPLGMELFPASDKQVSNIIEMEIEQCDIYVLIFGKRYGSIKESSHISYTEWEYDYAKKLEKPIVIFIKNIALSEYEVSNKDKLLLFITKVKQAHTPSFFQTNTQLIRKFSIALDKMSRDKTLKGLSSTNNQSQVTLNVMNSIHPCFHHYFSKTIDELNKNQNHGSDVAEWIVDMNYTLLDYWGYYLTLAEYSFDSLSRAIRHFALDKRSNKRGFENIDASSILNFFFIIRALEVVDNQFNPTVFGKYIGDNISSYIIKEKKGRNDSLRKTLIGVQKLQNEVN